MDIVHSVVTHNEVFEILILLVALDSNARFTICSRAYLQRVILGVGRVDFKSEATKTCSFTIVVASFRICRTLLTVDKSHHIWRSTYYCSGCDDITVSRQEEATVQVGEVDIIDLSELGIAKCNCIGLVLNCYSSEGGECIELSGS